MAGLSRTFGGPTNNITIDNDGRMKFVADATVWDDIRITPGAFQFPGVADPALVSWQPGGSGATYKIYEFAESDEVHATIQLPHTYKAGSDVKAHAHWTPRDRGAAESGNTVAWMVDISWANIDAAFPASTTYDLTDTCNGVDDRHEMTPEVTVTGTSKGISSILQLRFYRHTTDNWATDTVGNRPCLLEIDFHFEKDDVGSATSSAKEA